MLYIWIKDPAVTDIRPLWHLWRLGFVPERQWWQVVDRVYSEGAHLTVDQWEWATVTTFKN